MKNKQLITTCLVGVACALAAAIGTTAYYSNKEKEETPVVAEVEATQEEAAEEPKEEAPVVEEATVAEEAPAFVKAKANTTKDKKINTPVNEEAVEAPVTEEAADVKKTDKATAKKGATASEATGAQPTASAATQPAQAASQPAQSTANSTTTTTQPAQTTTNTTPAPAPEPQPAQPAAPSNTTEIVSSIPKDGPAFNGVWITNISTTEASDTIVNDVINNILENQ